MRALSLLILLAKQKLDEKRVVLLELRQQDRRLEVQIDFLTNYLSQEAALVGTKVDYQTSFYFFKRNIEDRCFDLRGKREKIKSRLDALQEEVRGLFQEKKTYELILQNRLDKEAKRLLHEQQKFLDEVASNQVHRLRKNIQKV